MPLGAWLDEELLDRLDICMKSFHPSTIEVSFRDPDYVLYRMPIRVLADLDMALIRGLSVSSKVSVAVKDCS